MNLMTQLKMNLKVRSKLRSILSIDHDKQHTRRSKCTLFPESSIKTAWDCLGFIFIVYQSIKIPYNLCFGVKSEGNMIIFDTIIDCFFMLDICKRSSTS